MAKATQNGTTLNTAQRLGSILKSARDTMRKDKGLNGDLDRIPMLAWMMFLKFLDDQEQVKAVDAEFEGREFTPLIESTYRWQDWTNPLLNFTGEDLIAFINNDEARRPDNQRGPGLFEYLRKLGKDNPGGRQRVIRNVFDGTNNRMLSGYLLKEVADKISQINFSSTDDVHTIGHIYESLLKEMRDAAGDSGEFYTPRAVVKFIVEAINPRLGEVVLDPACGTGGFLVETYNHLEKQATTNAERETLQKGSLFGGEAKPLPYLMAEMNLLLHGLEEPQIDSGNSLRFSLGDLGDRERVDVIMTNPPFGGEEEPGIQNNFAADKRTSETALLFLQLIMRKLRRQPKPGRAAVVIPNGTLFGDGVSARIKEEMLKEFNLHTIVRLPNGVFAPYTGIPTNILFFERGGPTQHVWYYEQPLPAGRKNYTKTAPIQFEEFADCLAWWQNRVENERAWKVPASTILANGCNLDIKNPNTSQDFEHMPPEQLVEDILRKEQRIAELMLEIKQALSGVSR